jgi:hypothetical protein
MIQLFFVRHLVACFQDGSGSDAPIITVGTDFLGVRAWNDVFMLVQWSHRKERVRLDSPVDRRMKLGEIAVPQNCVHG